MNWKRIDKSRTVKPTKGIYKDWKDILADEGYHQCVYCSTKDKRLGGIRFYHVEHFKPKSLFPELRDDINNLYYSCPICNVFKNNDWYDVIDDFNVIHYPNPSQVDYSDLFAIIDGGTLVGKNKCGEYLVIKLGLNRNQLLLDRKLIILILAYHNLKFEYQKLINHLFDIIRKDKGCKAIELLESMTITYNSLNDIKDRLLCNFSYSSEDFKK